MEINQYAYMGFMTLSLFTTPFFYFKTKKNIKEGNPAVWPETMIFKNPSPAGRYLTTVGPNLLCLIFSSYSLIRSLVP